MYSVILYERAVDVTLFLESHGVLKKPPVVSAAVMYDDPGGDSHLIVIHPAIYFKELTHLTFGGKLNSKGQYNFRMVSQSHWT